MKDNSSNSVDAVEVDPTNWVEDYGDALFRFAFYRVSDEAVAEDLSQEIRITYRKSLTHRSYMIQIQSMQSLMEVLNKTAEYLKGKGVENARLDSELLFAHILECERLDLYLQYDRLLPESELEDLRHMVRRRSRREPVQYIVGEVAFHGARLKVDSRALIPRSETEELVAIAIDRVPKPPRSILDLGTGCGALAIALARSFCDAEVTAVDFSEEALALASENLRLNGAEDRVSLIPSNWFASVIGRFDLIVANPPYLGREEWSTCDPEIREFEPSCALISGEDGLDDAISILKGAPAFLRENGLIIMEMGLGQFPALAAIAEKSGFRSCEPVQDMSARERFLFAQY